MLEHWGEKLVRLKANRIFEFTVVSVIIFAALLAGARTYDIDPSVQRLISVLDIAVTVFFVIELTLRFLTEQNKRTFLKNGWNVFDTVIVLISLIPVGNSEMVIVGRLLRIFRVLRMISIIPELRILLSSLVRALPQLGYIVLLMFIIFYIYAAIGSTLFHQINPQLWGDISVSLLTLFRVMTFEDWTDVMYETMKVYPLSWTYYLSFIFLTAFAFLNMVIGIVVNVIEQESQKERDEMLEQSGEPTMLELQAEIRELKVLLERRV
jgi:voltage-gated sodium channel